VTTTDHFLRRIADLQRISLQKIPAKELSEQLGNYLKSTSSNEPVNDVFGVISPYVE
jgi:hypothetical protein